MKLNEIFADHMILQANKPVHIFGEGEGVAKAELAGETGQIICEGGCWCISLPAKDYGGPYVLRVELNGVATEICDVYFGDVFLLSGQSNNQLKMWQTNTPDEYYRNNDALRLFTVDRLEDQGTHVLTEDGWKSFSADGTEQCMEGEHYRAKDGWISAVKEEIQFWPALGYLMGNVLSADRKVGLIACYQGASQIQSWLPNHFLEGTEQFMPLERRAWAAQAPEYSAWNGDGMLYEGMLEKILPFSLKAVLWYQGESNSGGEDGRREIYSGILAKLIEKWREDFRDEELLFLVVQIHDFTYEIEARSYWTEVQAGQEMACQQVSNAVLIRSGDICEHDTIHPPTKLPLAMRIVDALKGNTAEK